jgi:hypothetical protein
MILGLWGAMLFESPENCERVRLMVERAKTTGPLYGTLTFQVTDAVLPEFCRLAPAPRILVQTGRLLGRLRRVDDFQRAAANAPGFTAEKGESRNLVALGFAQDLVRKGGIQEFNEILAVAEEVARVVYEKEPHEKVSYLLPDPIDESVPPDESLL